MKDILKFLPQILAFIPSLMGNLKSIVILVLVLGVLGGIGYGVYYYGINIYKDPYKCFNNEIYERMSVESTVYQFKGCYCVNEKQTDPAVQKEIKQ